MSLTVGATVYRESGKDSLWVIEQVRELWDGSETYVQAIAKSPRTGNRVFVHNGGDKLCAQAAADANYVGTSVDFFDLLTPVGATWRVKVAEI